MEDLNLALFNKLREYDRRMRMDRAPGALFSGEGGDPAFQRDIVLVLLSDNEEGLSQRQLAELMRVSQSTLSDHCAMRSYSCTVGEASAGKTSFRLRCPIQMCIRIIMFETDVYFFPSWCTRAASR